MLSVIENATFIDFWTEENFGFTRKQLRALHAFAYNRGCYFCYNVEEATYTIWKDNEIWTLDHIRDVVKQLQEVCENVTITVQVHTTENETIHEDVVL